MLSLKTFSLVLFIVAGTYIYQRPCLWEMNQAENNSTNQKRIQEF